VVLSLCLLLLSTGCAKQPIVRVERVEIPIRQWVPIPAERIAPLDVPAVPADLTWGESLQLNGELFGVVEACQLDRTRLRALNERTPQHQ
jgi:hypothetical protein